MQKKYGSVDKYWGELKQKHKKQPFGDASASHLSLVLRHVRFQARLESATPPNAVLPSEVGGIAKRIKTARLWRKTTLQKSGYPKAQIKKYPNPFCITDAMVYVTIGMSLRYGVN